MSSFSLTLVTPKIDAEVKDLLLASQRLDIQINVRDVQPDEKIDNFDEIVIWRGSSVGKISKRTAVLKKINESHFLINPCLAFYPEATKKSFQQEYFAKIGSPAQAIPTYIFKSKEEIEQALAAGRLQFPLIEKPDIGNRGRGVRVINSLLELPPEPEHYHKRIYQKFIQNDGDFRVLIVGGKALGAMRRIAPADSLINNISLGGNAEIVDDPTLKNFLCSTAEMIARKFSLLICGVDLIQDQKTGVFYFLEVNTLPEWQGFQKVAGIDVARHILDFCCQILKRGKVPTGDLVLENYRGSSPLLRQKEFHFLSRMCLWTEDVSFCSSLKNLKESYLGETDADIKKLLSFYLNKKEGVPKNTPIQKMRGPYLEKYPDLLSFNDLLFKKLFAKTLYKKDLSADIHNLVKPSEFKKLREALLKDAHAIIGLSTPAINYLFLSSWHLGDTDALQKPDLERLIQQKDFLSQSPEELRLALYLITHCIIGQSLFYSQVISPHWKHYYQEKLLIFDKMVEENFSRISLDAKLEFLVCARMIDYIPRSRPQILEEAESSLAPNGNFIVDTHNIYRSLSSSQSFISSEHRNVLYLMAITQSPHYPLPETSADRR